MLDAHVMRRDAPTGSTASDDLDGALQSFKSSLDDLVKNIQVRIFEKRVRFLDPKCDPSNRAKIDRLTHWLFPFSE